MSDQENSQTTSNDAPATSGYTSTEDELIARLSGEADTKSTPEKPKKAAKTVTTTEDSQTNPKAEVAEEEDEEESEDEGDEESDEDQDEAEGDEEEPEETDEEDEEEADPEHKVVFTTPEGEEVTLSELKRGFLRQADYTKKTQEIAEQRQQAVQAFQAVEQHNNVVAEHLHMALGVLEPQLAELAHTDWDTLAQTDAYEYAEKRALFDQAQVRYQRLTAAAQQTVAQAQQQKQLKQGEYLRAEQQKLIMALPDLADPKVGPKLSREIKEYALAGVGLSPEEAGNLTDHRLVVVLNKARMYDQLLSAQENAGKRKLSKSPKRVSSAGTPPTKSERRGKETQALRARLKQSGSEDDLVRLLLGT